MGTKPVLVVCALSFFFSFCHVEHAKLVVEIYKGNDSVIVVVTSSSYAVSFLALLARGLQLIAP